MPDLANFVSISLMASTMSSELFEDSPLRFSLIVGSSLAVGVVTSGEMRLRRPLLLEEENKTSYYKNV